MKASRLKFEDSGRLRSEGNRLVAQGISELHGEQECRRCDGTVRGGEGVDREELGSNDEEIRGPVTCGLT
eukprot:scaffold49434_cov28-Tisochrysis_lutea.AAC.1